MMRRKWRRRRIERAIAKLEVWWGKPNKTAMLVWTWEGWAIKTCAALRTVCGLNQREGKQVSWETWVRKGDPGEAYRRVREPWVAAGACQVCQREGFWWINQQQHLKPLKKLELIKHSHKDRPAKAAEQIMTQGRRVNTVFMLSHLLVGRIAGWRVWIMLIVASWKNWIWWILECPPFRCCTCRKNFSLNIQENENPTSANVITLDGCRREKPWGDGEVKEEEHRKGLMKWNTNLCLYSISNFRQHFWKYANILTFRRLNKKLDTTHALLPGDA